MRPVKEYYSHWLPPMLGAIATTIGHNIFYAGPESQVSRKLRKHEMIHRTMRTIYHSRFLL